MAKQFRQVAWDAELAADWHALLKLAIAEDLGTTGDCTSRALVPPAVRGAAGVAARQGGIVAGLAAVPMTLAAFAADLQWEPQRRDGEPIGRGETAGVISGPARDMLSAERLVLNLLGRLSGIATLTARYVAAVAGTKAQIYDTRKTTPGWRRLEKYAVRCGGGCNHRTGLFEAVLIKDNHLAFGAFGAAGKDRYTPAEAVVRARQFAAEHAAGAGQQTLIVEVEVDTLAQLAEVLSVGPDLVLLDNMPPLQLRAAVTLRDAQNPAVELEASGGVNLETVRAIAESGVERISIGGLTHAATSLDLGLDWLGGEAAA